MSEREYPRWVHRHGNGDKHSLVAETPEQEQEILDRWAAEDAAIAPPPMQVQAVASGTNMLTRAVDAPAVKRGGWPKGKPRTPRSATVN